jgi:hypothetical protein
MFALNTFIDSFQNGKKYFVNSFVTDKSLSASINAFVDAQTAYTKQVVKTTTEVSESIASQVQKTLSTVK